MPIHPILAMTGAEMANLPSFSGEIAWMACHFSPYGLGLSNLPRKLPPGSLLMVDDITPIHGHDPETVAAQLRECIEIFSCHGILLDFQRSGNSETAALVKTLSGALPCPVAVSDLYAMDCDCPVFLPPAPPSVPLEEHLAPWTGREIWLDISPAGEELVLTESGTNIRILPCSIPEAPGFEDATLHCHYQIRTEETRAVFTLWRTDEDMEELIAEAENRGVTKVLGLYQELSLLGTDPSSGIAHHAE